LTGSATLIRVWVRCSRRSSTDGITLIPTRYPGSEAAADGPIALARKTVWQEIASGTHHGLGQRIIATDAGDVPLMEIRTLSITQEATPTTEPLAADHG
jgi:type VI secretion system protein ImpE